MVHDRPNKARLQAVLMLVLLAGCGGGGGDRTGDLSWNTDAVDGTTLGSTDTSGGGGSGGGDSGGDDSGGDGSGGGVACGTLVLCDDFESASAGAAPDASRWSIGGPNCFSGAGQAVVDATQAHSGSQSVRITPGSDYCGHAFIQSSAISQLGNVRYGRFYIRLQAALTDAHVTFLSMRDANDSSDSHSEELRIGGQSGVLKWNRSKDDATLPTLSLVGISMSRALPAQTWTCIEFRIDQSTGQIQTWVDGVAPAGLQADGVATADVDQTWINQYPSWRPALTDLKLGWEAYGGATNTVWIDDVALGSQRIGCEAL